jgi:L-ascorbate metabolism protein UlaG (beta-lactamase superfamily)
MKIECLGHAGFVFDDGRHRLVVDPFLTDNPLAKHTAADIHADYVLISHAHFDHFDDGLAIALRTGATIISTSEIAKLCASRGANSHRLHIGGAFTFPFGRVKLTVAHHGSTLFQEEGTPVTLGPPCGFIFQFDGKTIYHSGDTGLFLDMKLIGELDRIDLSLLPIGGNYTMDASDALKAVEFLNPRAVIPMHFNTFDLIKADPNDFARKAASNGVSCYVLQPGESMDFQ